MQYIFESSVKDGEIPNSPIRAIIKPKYF